MKKFPWHGVILIAYPVLFLFSHNIEKIVMADLWAPFSIVMLGGLAIFALLSWLLKSTHKGAILTSVLSFGVFGYGVYQNTVYGSKIPLGFTKIRVDHNFYMWVVVLLLVLVGYLLFRVKNKKLKITPILNIFSAVLLTFVMFKVISFQAQSKTTRYETVEVAKVFENTFRPSIYYIITDAYGREDVLKNYYQYDNSSFTNNLEAKGFYVADKSISNYGQTILSLPSSLNMTYLDSFAESVGADHKDRWPLAGYLNNNKVVQFLSERGYESHSFDASIWDPVFFKNVDTFYRSTAKEKRINLFELELKKTSVLSAIQHRINQKPKEMEIVKEAKENEEDPFQIHRNKINYAFKTIREISKIEGPKYVHGHVLSPHQPFVFNADGSAAQPPYGYTIWNPMEYQNMDEEYYKRSYINQLKYINTQLTQTVEAIQQNDKDAIIIIQGDHGPCVHLHNTKGLDNNDYLERFSILNAYYFPRKDYEGLYPEISPVNSFKVVLNTYFDKDLFMDKDRAFYSTWELPYTFHDVTDSLRFKSYH